MRSYKVTGGAHYDGDATTAVPDIPLNSFYILFPAKGIMSYSQIISCRLYVHLKRTCSLVGRAISNTCE